MTIQTDNLSIEEIGRLPTPDSLKAAVPMADGVARGILEARQAIGQVLELKDDRLLVIIGPCSIHDPEAAIDYAKRLKPLADHYAKDLLVVMRVYFEKPRTVVGWKGLITDPDLDGSFDVEKGLRMARKLLVDINTLGLPVATEFLDLVTGQYISDLVSWGAIGARTTESQVHREMASGLSCPVGFKNGTDGNVRIAVDAVRAARVPHVFFSPDFTGRTVIYKTQGNPGGHVILRGGKQPNYDPASIAAACDELAQHQLPPAVVVDCSHGNSSKQHKRQLLVAEDLAMQLAGGSQQVCGVMVESNLVEGNQKVEPDSPLTYGQSITDACIGWDDTQTMLALLSKAVQDRRQVA